MLGIRARRRAGVTVALAGMLGGAMVGFSSVEGATAPVPGGTGTARAAATPTGGGGSGGSPTRGGTVGSPTHSFSGSTGSPTHSGSSSTGSPTHSGSSGPTGSPTYRGIAAKPSFTPGSSPVSSPQGSPVAKASPTPSLRGTAPVSSANPSSTPRSNPTAAARTSPTPLPGNNNRNPNWKHDSQSWHQWDGAWQDPNWHNEHSRDSRHEQWQDNSRREHDDFHFDEFRNEDSSFRHDCDTLLTFHSVRALLDFLDGDSSLRDFFELHGDLYDFLVHHSDWSGDFDRSCTFIDLHL
ncbi:MAG TPA: hypothetical protein VGL20_04715 [Candidatus Dormibacteraeota bacterium]